MSSIRTRLAAFGAVALLPLPALLTTGPAAAHEGHPPPPDWQNFEKVTLTSEVGEPMSMAVLPDRRVLHTNRQGQIRLFDPQTASTRIITSLPVYEFSEDGMQGIALDPDFAENHWVYIYYSPVIEGFPTDAAPEQVEPGGDTSVFDEYLGHNQLSRFRFVDDPTFPHIDLDSEQVILELPIERGLCCHNGGDIDFDSQGNLFLSTGDDTNPFQSNGFAPIDERPFRNPGFDAQRTAANTADLRGKLLRIRVTDDGSYEIPDGNLFPAGEHDPELARPEIYAMGFRNPFRFSVDPVTDAVYLGDYGPDANQPDPARGPRATVEWNHITEPGNYGWPYCVGPGDPYVDFDFDTEESGEPFDCSAPVNDSPRNTGLRELPPVVPANVWWHNGFVNPLFPELGPFPGEPTGGGPMGGPAYKFDPAVAERFPTAFPPELSGIPVLYEWARDFLKLFHLGDDGQVSEILDMLPDADWHHPMDMEFGPDGSLYVLEYGGGFFVEHPEAKLSRVDFVADGRSPVARTAAQPQSGQPPLAVAFESEGTHHPDPGGEIVSRQWSFGDGTTSTEPHPTHVYQDPGVFSATLTVTDARERVGRSAVTVVVGNTAPIVDLQRPVDGGFFDFGDRVRFRVRVTDPEEGRAPGRIRCELVTLNSAQGHDEHAHPIGQQTGCDGRFEIPDAGHDSDLDLSWVISARFTDQGAGALPSLSGFDQLTLQPKRKQAEFFADADGVLIGPAQDPVEGGGQRLTGLDHGDWAAYHPVNLLNTGQVRFRVRSSGPGGVVELRRDAPDGALLGSAPVGDTGGEWVTVTAPVADPGETFALHLVFTAPAGGPATDLFDLNFLEAVGKGVAGPPRPPG
ncbi:MAG: carbohydrate-binding protein [Micromonosporaceae bacterium]|nr:carbohydrate-binding protein [Micromonosporaceae bacterium]